MNLYKTHDRVFQTEDTFITASLVTNNECAILTSSGLVSRWNFLDRIMDKQFSVNESPQVTYPDGGFDKTAACSIYTMDSITVIVNDYKTHGFVCYADKGHFFRIQREDHYASHSKYPVALFKNESSVPHLIFAEAWNHVQIVNLDTLQILTADKSLIEVGAEQRYLKVYENGQNNARRYPWPNRYDYFFADLVMSPNQQKFMSRGWGWGSADHYKVFDIKHFIENNRILDYPIDWWEHSNRAACWIDDTTIAVAINPKEEDEDRFQPKQPGEPELTQIYVYDLAGEEAVKTRHFTLDAFENVTGQLFYNKSLNALIAHSKTKGLTVCDLQGKILFKDELFQFVSYNPKHNMFLTLSDKQISFYVLQ